MKNLMSSLFGTRAKTGKDATTKSGFPASRTASDNPATIEDGSDNAMRRQLVGVLVRDALRRHGIPAGWVECQMLVVSSRSRGPGMYVRLVATHWDQRLMNYAFAFQKSLVADIFRFEPLASQWLHGISWQLEFADSCPYVELPDKLFWQTPAPAVELAGGSPPPQTQSASATSNQPAAPSARQPTAAELAAAARQANAARRAAPGKSSPASTFGGAPTEPAALAKQASNPNPSASGLTSDLARSEAAQDLERLFAIRDRELGQSAGDGVAPVGYEKTQPSSL